MKKLVILSVVALTVLPLGAFAVSRVIYNIASYEFIANIQTQDRGNVLIYKFADGNNTCYVSTHSFGTQLFSDDISCIASSTAVK